MRNSLVLSIFLLFLGCESDAEKKAKHLKTLQEETPALHESYKEKVVLRKIKWALEVQRGFNLRRDAERMLRDDYSEEEKKAWYKRKQEEYGPFEGTASSTTHSLRGNMFKVQAKIEAGISQYFMKDGYKNFRELYTAYEKWYEAEDFKAYGENHGVNGRFFNNYRKETFIKKGFADKWINDLKALIISLDEPLVFPPIEVD